MGVCIPVSVFPACIHAVMMIPRIRQPAFSIPDHFRIDPVYIRGMGEIHHVRRISACRPHIYLKSDEIPGFSKSGTLFFHPEEFQMHKP